MSRLMPSVSLSWPFSDRRNNSDSNTNTFVGSAAKSDPLSANTSINSTNIRANTSNTTNYNSPNANIKPMKSSRSAYLKQKASESLVVTEIDKFLFVVESKLEEFEQFGLEKLDSLDEQAKSAYVMMSKLRDEVIVGGKRKAGALRRFVDSLHGDDQMGLVIKKRTPSADFGNYVDYKKYKEKATSPLISPMLPRKSLTESMTSLPSIPDLSITDTSVGMSSGVNKNLTFALEKRQPHYPLPSRAGSDSEDVHSSGSSDDLMSYTGSVSSFSSLESYTFYSTSARTLSNAGPVPNRKYSQMSQQPRRHSHSPESSDDDPISTAVFVRANQNASSSVDTPEDQDMDIDSANKDEDVDEDDAAAEESDEFFLNHSFQEELNYIEELILENHLKISIQKALQDAASRLLTFEELPVPWQENPYISRGYRFCRGYTDCIISMAKLHNETCNIWSHLLGFFAMVGLACYHWPSTDVWQMSSTTDKLIMLVFLVCACKCLMFSAIWHTFAGISKLKVKKSFACVDYTGITLLIAASILTTEYSALYCRPVVRSIYMVATAMSGLGGVLFTWDPSFDKPESRRKRITFFISFAVAGALGFIHASYYHGLAATWAFYFPITKSLACYLTGVIAYGLLFPERYWTGGIFNYICMSHNLWHVCVFGGIYYHYMATIKLLENAQSFSCLSTVSS